MPTTVKLCYSVRIPSNQLSQYQRMNDLGVHSPQFSTEFSVPHKGKDCGPDKKFATAFQQSLAISAYFHDPH